MDPEVFILFFCFHPHHIPFIIIIIIISSLVLLLFPQILPFPPGHQKTSHVLKKRWLCLSDNWSHLDGPIFRILGWKPHLFSHGSVVIFVLFIVWCCVEKVECVVGEFVES